MYRIYWLTSSNEWELWREIENEDENIAYKRWNECCDIYPNYKVRMTKEIVIKEA